MDSRFATLPAKLQEAESGLVSIEDYDISGSFTIKSFELAVAIIQVANRADDFKKASSFSPQLLSEGNFIIRNSVNSLRLALNEIVHECSNAYSESLKNKEWVTNSN